MPEGDSIYKAAARLRPDLVGARVQRLWMRDRGDVERLRSTSVPSVATVGKNLLLEFETGAILRIHLGMKGRFGRGPFRRPPLQASLVIETERATWACFAAARADLHVRRDMLLEQRMRRLGPDVLAPDFDLEYVLARLRERSQRDRPISEVLLDQRVAAGIGNVFKSEVLFLAGLHPMRPIVGIDDTRLRSTYAHARRLMAGNLGPGLRSTTGAAYGIRRPTSQSRHYVYRRAGLACFRCRTPIVRTVTGDHARSTYHCPHCQRAAVSP